MSKEFKMPSRPEPDINTASHIGQRIVGYTEKTVDRLCREAIEADRAERQGEAVPYGYSLVPTKLLEGFTELNPSNYGHDEVCELNAWAVELVLAAETNPAPAQQPLSREAIVNAYCHQRSVHQFVEAFECGVRYAERHHNITGDKT